MGLWIKGWRDIHLERTGHDTATWELTLEPDCGSAGLKGPWLATINVGTMS